MAKHSSKRSPDGKRVRRVRPRPALRTPFSTHRSTQQEVLRGAENVLAEVERSTGLPAVKLVDLRRGARGGSVVVVEVESTRSGADAAPDWYVVGLNAEGRVVSRTLTQRPSLESGATSDAPLDARGWFTRPCPWSLVCVQTWPAATSGRRGGLVRNGMTAPSRARTPITVKAVV